MQVARIAVPVLVAVGSKDPVAGSPEELAALIPGAQALAIPGRDHMLAVGDRVFKAGVLNSSPSGPEARNYPAIGLAYRPMALLSGQWPSILTLDFATLGFGGRAPHYDRRRRFRR